MPRIRSRRRGSTLDPDLGKEGPSSPPVGCRVTHSFAIGHTCTDGNYGKVKTTNSAKNWRYFCRYLVFSYLYHAPICDRSRLSQPVRRLETLPLVTSVMPLMAGFCIGLRASKLAAAGARFRQRASMARKGLNGPAP